MLRKYNNTETKILCPHRRNFLTNASRESKAIRKKMVIVISYMQCFSSSCDLSYLLWPIKIPPFPTAPPHTDFNNLTLFPNCPHPLVFYLPPNLHLIRTDFIFGPLFFSTALKSHIICINSATLMYNSSTFWSLCEACFAFEQSEK